MNILGIIPARGGSKEVPRKNLLKIGKKSLIELATNSAKTSELLTRFLLSSDDDEIIKEGKKVGCPVYFKRPSDLATDKSSTFSVIKHTVSWLEENENWKPEIIVILQPTTPFRNAHHIDGVLDLLIKTKADAVITIRKPDYPPQWMLRLGKNKKLTNLIQGGNTYKRRQDAPVTYQPAGMVYAFKTHLLYEIETLFPFKDTRGYTVKNEEAINIDTYNDYQLAKIIYEKNIK